MTATEGNKLKLLDLVCEELRVNHYSRETEEAYTSWIERYMLFIQKTTKINIYKSINELGIKSPLD